MGDTDTPEPRAANVIEALLRVMRDLPGIAKSDESNQGYKYRGIEAITSETQALFARHGVVFAPRVLSREVREFTINNRPWTDDVLEIVYRVYGPGGVEDVIEVGPLYGIGRDNSDKGANKAMTQAFKYALLQTLCISDSKDDGDRDTHERDSLDRTGEVPPEEEARRMLYVRIKGLTDEGRERLGALTEQEGIPKKLGEWTVEHMARLDELLDEIESAGAAEGEPVDEALMEQAKEIVARMEDVALVKDHLQVRGLRRDGTHEAMRQRLVLAMYEEAKAQSPAIAPSGSPEGPEPAPDVGKDPEDGTGQMSARSEDLDVCAECGHTIDPDRKEQVLFRAGDGEPVHDPLFGGCPSGDREPAAPSGALL